MDNGLERRDCNIRIGFSCPYSGLRNLDLGIFWAGSLAPTWEIWMEISHHGIRGGKLDRRVNGIRSWTSKSKSGKFLSVLHFLSSQFRSL